MTGAEASATAVPRITSATDFTMVCGVIPCSWLYRNCASRRRFISSIARCIDFVI